MAKRRQPLIPGWLWPGLIAGLLLVLIASTALLALWQHAPESADPTIWLTPYLRHVIAFTFLQATLSSIGAVLPAILLARALYRRQFAGRQWLLRLCGMTMMLPVLVAVFGILHVYGRQGWLAQAANLCGFHYRFSPYGLSGILLVHIFFNLPLATRLLLMSLENIAVEQRQLAAQLAMNSWQRLRYLEWPALRRQVFAAGALVFMLCFASFAAVLSLGGGPRATTIELAVYQALSYDFDLQQAAMLAGIQLLCCLLLLAMSQLLSPALPVGQSLLPRWRDTQDSLSSKIHDCLWIAALLLLILPPLLAVLMSGINHTLFAVLQQTAFWQALGTSLYIAGFSSIVCLLLTIMLLWSSRELRLRHYPHSAQGLETSGMLILAMPGIVLATGFFLLLNDTLGLPRAPWALVSLTNGLMAIPYALKILDLPMRDLSARYHLLLPSLGLSGWQRLYWLELRALRAPLMQSLAFAAVLSLGDFGIMALFGNQDFRTLPFYLYQQMGAYRHQESAVTALFLLLLSGVLFTVIERLATHHADSK